MLSPMNALANQSSSTANRGESPEIVEANSGNENSQNAEIVSNQNKGGLLYEASRQLSASSEMKSENQYAGVKLDINQNMEMGVHDKTAHMMIETNVRLSIKSRFEGIPANESAEQPAKNKFNPEDTAKRLVNFARRFMNGFLEKSDNSDSAESLQEFTAEVADAAEEGFEEARQEFGDNFTDKLEKLFSQVHENFKEQLSNLEQINTPEQAPEESEDVAVANRVGVQNNSSAAEKAARALQNNNGENVLPEIMAENNRLAAASKEIPAVISNQLQG